jgi:hypothetical protein
MPDTTKEIEFSRQICTQCWFQHERVTWNINGRCDVCGGTDWIDAGQDHFDKFEEQQERETEFDYVDLPEETQSYRELAMEKANLMRENKKPNPFRKSGFWKE